MNKLQFLQFVNEIIEIIVSVRSANTIGGFQEIYHLNLYRKNISLITVCFRK